MREWVVARECFEIVEGGLDFSGSESALAPGIPSEINFLAAGQFVLDVKNATVEGSLSQFGSVAAKKRSARLVPAEFDEFFGGRSG